MVDYFRIYSLIGIIFCLKAAQCSAVPSVPTGKDEPWFTGPLLTPSARVVPVGHFNLEPYLFYHVTTGRYDDNWKAISTPTFNRIDVQLQLKAGIFERVDFTFAPQGVISFTRGKTGSSLGDLPVGFSYQLYKGDDDDWVNYVRFSVAEIFPIGKFRNLDPAKLGTDAHGQGSFLTIFGLTVSKLFKFSSINFLSCRWNVATTLPTTANVRGFNIFGGGPRTRGRVHHKPGFSFLAGAEYTVTRRFSLACDFLALYSSKIRFSGFTDFPVARGESIQFSLAPAVEYNWSSSMGIIVGAWFTLAGKNAGRFVTGVAAFNYIF